METTPVILHPEVYVLHHSAYHEVRDHRYQRGDYQREQVVDDEADDDGNNRAGERKVVGLWGHRIDPFRARVFVEGPATTASGSSWWAQLDSSGA